MFEYSGKIRYSETNAKLHLTIPALLNYFQDCAIFETEDTENSVEKLIPKQITWVLSSWQVLWNRMPKLNEEVIIGTMPYGFRGFIGYRNFYLKSAKTGEQLACAASVWTLIDTSKLIPVRPDEDFLKCYHIAERLDMPYADRRIRMTGEGIKQESIIIKKSQIDSNHHVNNAEYVNMAMDFIPSGKHIDQLRVEYKKSAVLNDEVVPFVFLEEERVVIQMKNLDGEIYASVEFRFRK